MVAVEGGSVRTHGPLGIGAHGLDPGYEALVVAQLLGCHLAEATARFLVFSALGISLGDLVGLPLTVGDGPEDLDQCGVHRFSFRGRRPSSKRATTKSATTEAGTPSSVASRRRASWPMRAATEKATILDGASTTSPAA